MNRSSIPWQAWLLLALFALSFAANIGGYDLWPADEPRFAEVAREMHVSGDYLTPTVNGVRYAEKPPILFWAISLVSAVTGVVDGFSARLPSVIAAIITLYFTFLLARRLFDERVALLAMTVLGSATSFWWEARTAQTDMLLTACMTMALYAFWRWHESRRGVFLIGFYAAIAAGALVKGPPAYIFPLLLVWSFYWRRPSDRKQVRLLYGSIAVWAVFFLWYAPAHMFSPAEVNTMHVSPWENIYRNTVGRLMGVSKAGYPWKYFFTLPADFFPWSLLLPWTIGWVWHVRRSGPPMRLLLAWTIPAFIFFSISIGKRSIYLLPLFPAIAILIAISVIALQQSDRQWWRRIPLAIWGAVLLLFAAAPIGLRMTEYADLFRPELWLVSALCAAMALGCFTYAAFSDGRKFPVIFPAYFSCAAVLVALFVFPMINEVKGASAFCEPVRRAALTGSVIRVYSLAFSREEYILYSRHYHDEMFTNIVLTGDEEPKDFAKIAGMQRHMLNTIGDAVEDVPVETFDAVSDAELEALQAALDDAVKGKGFEGGLIKQFEKQLSEKLAEWDTAFANNVPSYVYVQSKDWRWMIALRPGLRRYAVLNHSAVGSREVLLLANDAGVALIDGLPAVP